MKGRHGRPCVHRAVLDNGLRVVLCLLPHLSQAYVSLFFKVGSRHESLDTNGITHVLEHMLFRGSARYKDAKAFNTAAEAIGGCLEGATYRDHVNFSTGCHPSGLKEAVFILGELVSRPRYASMEVERHILREELLESLDAHGRMIDMDNIIHRLMFGNKGLGMPIEGTLDNLNAVQVSDLEKHRRRYGIASNAVLCIAGPLNRDQTLAWAQKAFQDLPTGPDPLASDGISHGLGSELKPFSEPVVRYIHDTGSQVDISLAFQAFSIHDPDYPVLVMLGRLLADGLASRLHAELVDRQGLAYALHAGEVIYEDCGLFEFEISVAPSKALDALKALLTFVEASRRFRYSPEELKRVYQRYMYGLEFMMDGPSECTGFYGRSALFNIDNISGHLHQALKKVTASQVRWVSRRLFRPEALVCTAIGPLNRRTWRHMKESILTWSP